MVEMDNAESVRKSEAIMAKAPVFQAVIDQLKQNIDSLQYAIIATDDGFPVAYTEMPSTEATGKAALTASVEGLCMTVTRESHLKQVEVTQIECTDGFVFNFNVHLDDEKHVILMAAFKRSDINQAALQYQLKKAMGELVAAFNQ